MNRKIINILICCLLIALFITVYHIGRSLVEYRDDQAVYSNIKDLAIVEDEDPIRRQVDFIAVGSNGCSAASWIYIPDTNIDYPLVQGKDNEAFLTKNAYGEESRAGAIFLNCDNDARLTDVKSIIFGHNMKDGSMFHDLGKYKKEEFANAHKKMYIYHADGSASEYQLICTLSTVWNDHIYTVSTEDTVKNELDYLEKRADTFYGRAGSGNLVILSTCIKDEKRYVCVFQKIDDLDDISERAEYGEAVGMKVVED